MNVLALRHERKQARKAAEHRGMINRAIKALGRESEYMRPDPSLTGPALTPKAELALLKEYAHALDRQAQAILDEFGSDGKEAATYMMLEKRHVLRHIGNFYQEAAKPARLAR